MTMDETVVTLALALFAAAIVKDLNSRMMCGVALMLLTFAGEQNSLRILILYACGLFLFLWGASEHTSPQSD